MISISIAIYNAEKYLQECIDSVICQTYNDWELILVDDGSTDNSPAICKGYSKNDNRIKYVRKVNGGPSSARNVGIENSRGEYIMFLDADDYLKPNALELMIGKMIENDVDVVCCECQSVYPDRKEFKYKRPYFEERIVDSDSFLQRVLTYNTLCASWGKLYKKSLIENYRFVVGLLIAEDVMHHITVFSQVSCKILDCPERVIYYRILSNSLSHSQIDSNTLTSRIKSYISEIEKLKQSNPLKIETFKPYIAYNVLRHIYGSLDMQGLFKHVNDWHKKTAQDNLPLCKDHINDGYIKFFKKVLELSGMELDLYATLYFMPTYIKNQLKRFVRSLK